MLISQVFVIELPFPDVQTVTDDDVKTITAYTDSVDLKNSLSMALDTGARYALQYEQAHALSYSTFGSSSVVSSPSLFTLNFHLIP